MAIIVQVPRHLTMDDVDMAGRTVLVRCDMNVPVDKETKQIRKPFKIEAHKETLKELMEREAKIVVLSHQSRPGKPDCISLKEHSKVLSGILDTEVKFVDDIYGEKAKGAIKELEPGEVLVLENLRFDEQENVKGNAHERSQTDMVKELSSVADLYICDAFACTHRSSPSMVGFPHVMPSIVARLMERELKATEQVNWNPKPPMGYVLGGAKLGGTFLMMEHALEKELADYILVTGVPSLVFLKAAGYDLGKGNDEFLAKNGHDAAHKSAVKLLELGEDTIYLPIDLAVEKDGKRVEIDVDELPTKYPIKDIGSKTAEEFTRLINTMKTVFCNGTAGVFEDSNFSFGTKEIFSAIAKSSAYSVIGGGDTSGAIRKLEISGFDHVSSGGGALLNLLAGKESESLKEILTQRVPLPPRS